MIKNNSGWFVVALFFLIGISQQVRAEPYMVILHQTACQFIAAEGGNKAYSASSFEACEAFNDRTEETRLAQQKELQLVAGDYIFRIYNDDVPYILGFWLRGQGVGRLTLPSISGGGIQMGTYKDYIISLKAGEYYYSCPLNPTPDYTLKVIEKTEG